MSLTPICALMQKKKKLLGQLFILYNFPFVYKYNMFLKLV